MRSAFTGGRKRCARCADASSRAARPRLEVGDLVETAGPVKMRWSVGSRRQDAFQLVTGAHAAEVQVMCRSNPRVTAWQAPPGRTGSSAEASVEGRCARALSAPGGQRAAEREKGRWRWRPATSWTRIDGDRRHVGYALTEGEGCRRGERDVRFWRGPPRQRQLERERNGWSDRSDPSVRAGVSATRAETGRAVAVMYAAPLTGAKA